MDINTNGEKEKIIGENFSEGEFLKNFGKWTPSLSCLPDKGRPLHSSKQLQHQCFNYECNLSVYFFLENTMIHTTNKTEFLKFLPSQK